MPSERLERVCLVKSASHFEVLDLPNRTDIRGSLTILDGLLPFDIVRIFWISDADNQVRGGHRHRTTRQALVALAGRVTVFMDDGTVKESIELDKPTKCLIVEPKDWHTMTFGDGAILVVMASREYDASDYIDARYE